MLAGRLPPSIQKRNTRTTLPPEHLAAVENSCFNKYLINDNANEENGGTGMWDPSMVYVVWEEIQTTLVPSTSSGHR
eukprot:scaffold39146_cov63-Attheya_sp.AAC.1